MATYEKIKNKDSESIRVKIRIKGPPSVSETFDGITKAKIWAAKTETEIREGKYFKGLEATKHTLEDLINRYIKNELPNRDSDQQKFQMHLEWWKSKLGKRFLSDISSAKISECLDDLANEPTAKCKDKEGNPSTRALSTVNRYLATLSILFTYGQKHCGWLTNNVCSDVPKRKESRGRTRFLTENEVDRLLTECRKVDNQLLYLLVTIALNTGARHGEIINLTWDNVDFVNDMFYFIDTKNGEDRGVSMPSIVKDELLKHRKIRHIKSNLLFARPDGLKAKDLRWHWEQVLIKAKIENFKFHDLRHTAASYFAMDGASLLEIAEILGHKTLAMVQRYAHLTKKHTAKIMEETSQKRYAHLVNQN